MKQSNPSKAHSRQGFSLIEVVAVLALLGIVAAGYKRILPDFNIDLSKETDRLTSHVRNAQVRAQADTYEWRVVFTDATSYQIGPVVLPGPGFTPRVIPESGQLQGLLKNGVTASPGFMVRFDSWGRPLNDAGVPFSSNKTVTLRAGAETQSFTILAHTGLIQ